MSKAPTIRRPSLADREAVLPAMAARRVARIAASLEPKSHTTQPPARFTEATLTRSLEEMGIGRPSTYASIIDTILAREYVFKRGTALVPTWTAMAVSQLLESHLPNLVDYQFTAQMEDDLGRDQPRRSRSHVAYLHNFYFGDGKTGLKPHLESKEGEINARDVSRVRIAQPDGEEPMYRSRRPVWAVRGAGRPPGLAARWPGARRSDTRIGAGDVGPRPKRPRSRWECAPIRASRCI